MSEPTLYELKQQISALKTDLEFAQRQAAFWRAAALDLEARQRSTGSHFVWRGGEGAEPPAGEPTHSNEVVIDAMKKAAATMKERAIAAVESLAAKGGNTLAGAGHNVGRRDAIEALRAL